jgi:hypothetical protein
MQETQQKQRAAEPGTYVKVPILHDLDTINASAFFNDRTPTKEVALLRDTAVDGVQFVKWLKDTATPFEKEQDPGNMVEKSQHYFLTHADHVHSFPQNLWAPDDSPLLMGKESRCLAFENSCMVLYLRSKEELKGQSAHDWSVSVARQMTLLGGNFMPGQMSITNILGLCTATSISENKPLCPPEFGDSRDFFLFVYFQELHTIQ